MTLCRRNFRRGKISLKLRMLDRHKDERILKYCFTIFGIRHKMAQITFIKFNTLFYSVLFVLDSSTATIPSLPTVFTVSLIIFAIASSLFEAIMAMSNTFHQLRSSFLNSEQLVVEPKVILTLIDEDYTFLQYQEYFDKSLC